MDQIRKAPTPFVCKEGALRTEYSHGLLSWESGWWVYWSTDNSNSAAGWFETKAEAIKYGREQIS